MTKHDAVENLIEIITNYRKLQDFMLVERHANSVELSVNVGTTPKYDDKWLKEEKEKLNIRLREAFDAINFLNKS